MAMASGTRRSHLSTTTMLNDEIMTARNGLVWDGVGLIFLRVLEFTWWTLGWTESIVEG